MRRHARVLFAIAALASFFAFATAASAAYELTGKFSGPGAPNEQNPTFGRAAVEQSTGNVFVVNLFHDRVEVFKPNGSGTADFLTEFGDGDLSQPWGIAIDEQGGETHVYVADAANEEILKYDSDEAATPAFAIDAGFNSPAKGEGAGQVKDFNAAIAVDPATHDLLVADPGNKRVSRFQADGTPDGSFDGSAGAGSPGAFQRPIDLAVNSAGDVYVIDANGPNLVSQEGTSQVLRYSAAGSYKATLSPVGPNQRPATVAVNLANDEVVVSGEQDAIARFQSPTLHAFDAANSPLPSPAFNADYESVMGLAIAAKFPAQLYVVLDLGFYFGGYGYGTPEVQRFTQPPVREVLTGETTNLTPTGATFNGTIDPGGIALTECKFEYRKESGLPSTVPCAESPGAIGAGEAAVPVHADVTGLSADVYQVRLVAANSFGVSKGAEKSLAVPGAPVIVAQSSNVVGTTAYLRARINPANLGSSYRFEYGLTSAYGSSTAAAPIAAGNEPVAVVQRLEGLQPATEYHFRVVATNDVDEVAGADQVLTTEATPAPQACPNEPIRATQGATYLADCRAYEQISPVDKVNASLLDFSDGGAIWNLTNVNEDGSIATFQSRGGFADAANNNYLIDYVAKRGPGGWTTTSPVSSRPSGFASMEIGLGYSDDFSAYFSFYSEPSAVPGGSPGRNLYMRDLDDGSTQVLTGGALPGSSTTPEVTYIKASPGRKHVFFETSNSLTAAAPAGAASHLYDWTGGKAELVGVLPDGSVDPEGSAAGAASEETSLFSGVRNAYRAVSADGSRAFFTSPPNNEEAQVYVRIGGTQTKHVSKSQRTVPDPAGPQPAFYWGASEDGSVAYFTSAEKLTDDSTADAATGKRDLYRYEVDSGQLTDISVDPAGADVRNVAAVSEDGSRVYFLAAGALTPDAQPSLDVNLYAWHEGETKLVAGDVVNEGFRLGGNGFGGDSQRSVAATPDGRRFAFVAKKQLTGYDAGEAKSIYIYDAPSDSLRCVSCNPTGEPPSYGNVLYVGGNALTPTNTFGDENMIYQPTRSITDDGSRVFFTSDDALLPQDVNGYPDVYQWSEGKISLVSSGHSEEGAFLQTITPSGSDVLFGTRERLAASDGDNARDLYTARVGGGFPPSAQLSPCAGESCRGPSSSPPALPAAGTAAFSGPANPPLKKKNRHKGQKKKKKAKKTKARQKKHDKHRDKPATKRHG